MTEVLGTSRRWAGSILASQATMSGELNHYLPTGCGRYDEPPHYSPLKFLVRSNEPDNAFIIQRHNSIEIAYILLDSGAVGAGAYG
jgi:hypothetical protein